MKTFVFTPSQCRELLVAIEKVRARSRKRRAIQVSEGTWEENKLKAYIVATKKRHDIVASQDDYSFSLTRGGDSVDIGLRCVHDCGQCVYYVYTLTTNEPNQLAGDILSLVNDNPSDLSFPYVAALTTSVYRGIAA